MSDVVVSVTESTTTVAVTENSVNVAVTETPVTVSTSSVGLQGATGAKGDTGATGPAGSAGVSGVISVNSPITNTGSASSAVLGLDQSVLSLTRSQISDFTSGTVVYATASGTATNAGSAYYAVTAGTAVNVSGTVVASQVAWTSITDWLPSTYYNTGDLVNYAGVAYRRATAGTTAGTFIVTNWNQITPANSAFVITRSQVSDYAGGTVAAGTANALLTGDNSFVGQNTFTPTNASSTALLVVGQPSQGAPLQQWRSSSASLVSLNADGGFTLPNASITASGVASFGQIQVTPNSSATIGVIVKNAASQSANLQEWQTVGGTTMALISSSGAVRTTGAIAAGSTASIGQLTSVAPAATTLGFVQKGAASQLADLIQLQTSASVILGGRNAVGQIYTGSTAGLTTSVGGATTAATSTAGTATITTTSAHNIGSGDLVVVAGITPGGFNGTYVVTAVPSSTAISYVNATSGPQTVAGTISVYAQTSIVSRSAATSGLIIRGAASQSTNLTTWQNSGGNTVTSIGSAGGLYTDVINGQSSLSATISLGASRNLALVTASPNYGGGSAVIMIGNAAGTPTSNPTGGGILYVESGALKYRGSSGTITTLGSA